MTDQTKHDPNQMSGAAMIVRALKDPGMLAKLKDLGGIPGARRATRTIPGAGIRAGTGSVVRAATGSTAGVRATSGSTSRSTTSSARCRRTGARRYAGKGATR